MSSKDRENMKDQDEGEKQQQETRNAAADKEFLLEVCCYRIARELNVIALFLTLAKIGENKFQ